MFWISIIGELTTAKEEIRSDNCLEDNHENIMYPQTQPTKKHTLKVCLNKIIAAEYRNEDEKCQKSSAL